MGVSLMSLPTEEKFQALLALIVKLRSPDGCPWDRSRRREDIGRYLIEEAYEVLEALEAASAEGVKEELGDLLFQILFLAVLAEEAAEFDMADVLDAITAKMIRRHPHVFSDATVTNIKEVCSNWERIKREVEHKGAKHGPLGHGIPRSVSTLARAQRITAQASTAGFDWPDISGVLRKLEEEIREFRTAQAAGDLVRMREEAGDLLLTAVNLCRFVPADAEAALRAALGKFAARFTHIERELATRGKTAAETDPSELDRLWEEAKTKAEWPNG
jgi:tetrapyrrole methylase family protein/MazG family protein